jgi:hypothetical protein
LQDFGASDLQHCETLAARERDGSQHYATFLDTSGDSDERTPLSNGTRVGNACQKGGAPTDRRSASSNDRGGRQGTAGSRQFPTVRVLTAATPSFFGPAPFHNESQQKADAADSAIRGPFALDQVRPAAAMRRFAITIPLLARKGAR